jgi:hypothetical protein
MELYRASAWFSVLPLLFSSACQPTKDDDAMSAGASASGGASGSHAGGSGGSDVAGSSHDAAGAAPVLHGSVVVSLAAATTENEGYSSVLGRFFDGPTPPAIPLELDTELGDCQLMVPSQPFCSTPCAPDVCTADDVCTPYPTPLAVGTLSVEGLGPKLSIDPSTSMSIYQSPSLPYPPCSPGSAIHVTASAFSLTAECIEPLELTGADPIVVKAGAAVHVTWKAAGAGASSRIRIGLDVAHHGGKKGEIDCEVPDTGSFDIPEPLVSKLVSLGLAGYPTISVSRVAVGEDQTLPDVVLLVSQNVQRAVDTGVSSCQEDSECDAPEVCQPTRTCG